MCVNISSIKRIFSNQSHYFPDIPCILSCLVMSCHVFWYVILHMNSFWANWHSSTCASYKTRFYEIYMDKKSIPQKRLVYTLNFIAMCSVVSNMKHKNRRKFSLYTSLQWRLETNSWSSFRAKVYAGAKYTSRKAVECGTTASYMRTLPRPRISVLSVKCCADRRFTSSVVTLQTRIPRHNHQ